MAFHNRPYQDNCHSAIRKEYLNGFSHQLVSMATGTGKTVVFSQLPEKMNDILPGQQMVYAHREELIGQAVDKMREANPGLRVDKEIAEHHADPSLADVIIASVPTLGRKENKRLRRYNWERIDKHVTDEAHHSTAQSYLNIYEAAGLMTPGDKRLLLGVTATPQRSDGQALAKIYQKISFVYSMRQAIEDGWLVDVRGIRVRTSTSLDRVKISAGDFAIDSLADAVNNPARNQLVVKAWLEKGENRQTVGFCVNIQHAKDLADMFRYYGVKAEALWGDDPDRAEKLAAHRRGEITVILNCAVLTEGYDDWRIGCILLASPTKSGVKYVQMVGRGTRLEDGCGNLILALEEPECPYKRDCIVIDVVDSSTKHSLVTLPTLMGMAAKLDLRGKSLIGSIKRIEEAQRENPNVDFSTLQDIDSLTALIESVNLFDVKFPEEVEANSDFTWHSSASGGYVLQLPDRDQIKIQQNLLDKWELIGSIKNKRYKGERDTIEAIFEAADNLVRNIAPDTLNVIKREAGWHSKPATLKQVQLLQKLMKGRPLPKDLDSGKASRLIGSFLAGKN